MTMRAILVLGTLAIAALAACEQPFFVPQGGFRCPKGEHQYFDKNRGWICVPDSTPPDSVS